MYAMFAIRQTRHRSSRHHLCSELRHYRGRLPTITPPDSSGTDAGKVVRKQVCVCRKLEAENGAGMCRFPPLCTHPLWAYAPILRGAMPPCCVELCLPTPWSYASILPGAIPPHFTELSLHGARSYGSILPGGVTPVFSALRLRTLRKYA